MQLAASIKQQIETSRSAHRTVFTLGGMEMERMKYYVVSDKSASIIRHSCFSIFVGETWIHRSIQQSDLGATPRIA
ncbi:uncharacterized protein LOC143145192 isoform X2 [Ptiloglossa arizonensis]|uniref:uncharacterized protein LOC143145192 isoform X2 n=1 Tax=Ptiloglossa arizonensis TaxID=3350558 RepID=UPI003F9FFEA6